MRGWKTLQTLRVPQDLGLGKKSLQPWPRGTPIDSSCPILHRPLPWNLTSVPLPENQSIPRLDQHGASHLCSWSDIELRYILCLGRQDQTLHCLPPHHIYRRPGTSPRCGGSPSPGCAAIPQQCPTASPHTSKPLQGKKQEQPALSPTYHSVDALIQI